MNIFDFIVHRRYNDAKANPFDYKYGPKSTAIGTLWAGLMGWGMSVPLTIAAISSQQFHHPLVAVTFKLNLALCLLFLLWFEVRYRLHTSKFQQVIADERYDRVSHAVAIELLWLMLPMWWLLTMFVILLWNAEP